VGLFRKITKRLRAAWWRKHHNDFLLIFNWHQVTPSFDPAYHHRYTWTQLEQFETELAYLTDRFRILALPEAISRLDRGSLQGPCATLTFDDGDISASEHISPLLERLRLPATFFINTAYIDGKYSYWFPILSFFLGDDVARASANVPKDLLSEAKMLRHTNDPILYNRVRNNLESFASLLPFLGSRLVSREWLSSLDGDQFSIGAHGHEHQRFSMMSKEWQSNDLYENIRVLSQFRAFRPFFAVPFGGPNDWTEETIRISKEHGLDVVLADGGVNLASGHCYRRNPSDGRSMRQLLVDAFSQA